MPADTKFGFIEVVQRLLVRLVATNPAGHGLCLIGGFRYRFLDGGSRRSLDVDYHWDGDLAEKQQQLIALFRRRLLPEVQRRWGYEGRADPGDGPATDSPTVRVVELAFWQEGRSHSRIEIPVDITRMECADRPIVRTADGVVYLSATDQDMIESKVISIFARLRIEHRDLVDLFLFANQLRADSAGRIRRKLVAAGVREEGVRARCADLSRHRPYHVRSIAEILATQLDPEAAAAIGAGGGAEAVLNAVAAILIERLGLVLGGVS